MDNTCFETKYLQTKNAWDNVNQTLKSIIDNQEEIDKEQIIHLLKECTVYFNEKVRNENIRTKSHL